MGVNVIIRDFQSIVESKIKIQGITLLKGQSGAGKSSHVRALYAATHNRFKPTQIRYGSEQIEVKIKFDESPDVLAVRRREQGSPRVSLGNSDNPEGRRIWGKLNRDLPSEVDEFLNLGTINVSNSEKYDLNFFTQFEPPILVGFSQKKIMDILSASKAVDDLNRVRKELDIRRLKTQGAFDNVAAVIDSTKAKIAILEDMALDYNSLDEIEPLIKRYEKIKSQIDSLSNLLSLLKERDKLTRLIITIGSSLVLIEEREEIVLKKNKYESLVSNLKKKISLKEGVENLSTAVDLASKTSKLSELRDVLKTKRIIQSEMRTLSVMKEVSLLNEEKERLSLRSKRFVELDVAFLNAKRIKARISRLNELIPKYEAKDELERNLNLVKSNLNKLGLLKSLVTTRDLLNSDVDRLDMIVTQDLCPYCGNKMNKEHKHL